jgi:diguanylate cyclase (GGDEF)-like protein
MGYPETMRDVLKQVKREEISRRCKELTDRPVVDHVTGFYNERYFYLRLDAEMAKARRSDKCLSLIMMEAGCIGKDDNTAKYPDGHTQLKLTSKVITSCIRHEIDIPFRYGEDRLAIILPELNKLQADNVARGIYKRLEKAKIENITIYAGVVECDYHEHAEEFIKAASDALSMSKKESKGK